MQNPVVASNGGNPEQLLTAYRVFIFTDNYQERGIKMMELLSDSLSESFVKTTYADVKDKYSLEMMAESCLGMRF